MTAGPFFIYRPHVHGPEIVTTPDLVLDRAEIENAVLGADRLGSNTTLACADGQGIAAAIAIVAAQYGEILAPAFIVAQAGMTIGAVIGRDAFRRSHHATDWSNFVIEITTAGKTHSVPMPNQARTSAPPRGSVRLFPVQDFVPTDGTERGIACRDRRSGRSVAFALSFSRNARFAN